LITWILAEEIVLEIDHFRTFQTAVMLSLDWSCRWFDKPSSINHWPLSTYHTTCVINYFVQLLIVYMLTNTETEFIRLTWRSRRIELLSRFDCSAQLLQLCGAMELWYVILPDWSAVGQIVFMWRWWW